MRCILGPSCFYKCFTQINGQFTCDRVPSASGLAVLKPLDSKLGRLRLAYPMPPEALAHAQGVT